MTNLVDINPYEDTLHALQKIQLNMKIINNFMAKVENGNFAISSTSNDVNIEAKTRFLVEEAIVIGIPIKGPLVDHPDIAHVYQITRGDNASGYLCGITPHVYDLKEFREPYDNDLRYRTYIKYENVPSLGNPFHATDNATHIKVDNVDAPSEHAPGTYWAFNGTAPAPLQLHYAPLEVAVEYNFGSEIGWKEIGRTKVYITYIPGKMWS